MAPPGELVLERLSNLLLRASLGDKRTLRTQNISSREYAVVPGFIRIGFVSIMFEARVSDLSEVLNYFSETRASDLN